MKVKMLDNYQGWKHPALLARGAVVDLPDELVEYLEAKSAPMVERIVESEAIAETPEAAALAPAEEKHARRSKGSFEAKGVR
jgi:hypothetical protein